MRHARSAQRFALRAGLLAVAAAAGGCAANPFAQSDVSDVDKVFLSAAGNWDRNHDGIVTCDEWKAYAGELFDAADANRDGFLDATEFATITRTDKMFVTADFDYFDTARTGKVSRAQFVDRQNPAFRLLDKQNTCQLTATELGGGRRLLENRKPTVAPPPVDKDVKR